jgi:CHAT domain
MHMRTVVIRIADSADRVGYPVELLTAGTDDPKLVAHAAAVIPRSLSLEKPLKPDGKLLTAKRARELYRTTAGESEDLENVGEFLYRLVARGKVGEEWQLLRDEVGKDARTMLDIAPALQELHALPWELMRADGTAVFLDRAVISRGEPRQIGDLNLLVHVDSRRYSFPPDDWPLRVLIVFGADPGLAKGSGEDSIGANAELSALETLFSANRFEVEFDVLENPSRDDIVGACQEVVPHILHFIGHGVAGARSEDHRLQIYRNKAKEYDSWRLRDLQNDLRNVALRFAFLNACRTGENAAAGSEVAPVASMSDAFLRLGALGVLAMQGDIPGDLAETFSCKFYEKILARQPVDRAVHEARWEISRLRENVTKRAEWSYPVLRTRVHPSLVLPRRPDCDFNPAMVQRFVGRLPQRRRVRDAVRNGTVALDPADGLSKHFVVLVGQQEVGKSHLAKWCDQVWARGGLRTAYVEFREGEQVDVLGALRWIRDGRNPAGADLPLRPLPGAPLPASAFRQFNWQLNHNLKGVSDVPPLPDREKEILDEGTPLARAEGHETLIEDTLEQFCRALEEAAKPNGLVLILDRLEGLEATTRTQWLPDYLFRPVAAGGQRVHL